MVEDPEVMARVFQALAAGTRIRLLCMLKDRPMCVGDIAAELGVTQGAVSQHLRILRSAGLVEAERQGYHVRCAVRHGALEACREALECILQSRTDKPTGKAGRCAGVEAAGPKFGARQATGRTAGRKKMRNPAVAMVSGGNVSRGLDR
jgi:ArsR family transcriptional regulator